MDNPLHPAEVRVLGALIEKESTTPEYYPLTLNSLVAACNQKSNRWPVTEYDEGEVMTALDGLRARGFAASITGGSRVTKYAQRFTEKLNLGRRETAILCVLMLRGQQTPGEIKGRTERIYSFSDLDETETVLQKMIDGDLVQKLAPAAGMKEARFTHTFGGVLDQPVAEQRVDRISALEAEVSRLREEVADLRRRLDEVLS
jgi:uncharacterized protein YceH (UPF0502 family)